MRVFKAIFLTLALISGMAACSEEKEATPYTYTQIFSGKTEKTWVIQAVLVKEEGESDQQIELLSCELDDRYVFRADEEKSFIISNGASACDPEEGDIYVEHTWSFVNAGAVLTIAIPRVFGNFVIPFIVKEATDDRMTLEVYANLENTISYQIIMRAVDEQ